MPKLEILDLDCETVTDAGMRILARAPALRQLGIRAPKVTDQGVQAICKLDGLESLGLQDAQITDQGVRAICRLDNLEQLGLQDTQITNVGLRYIGTLKHLHNFGISEEDVASGSDLQAIDDGLKYIAGLPKLRSLTLHTSRVTDHGLAQLAPAKGLRRLDLLILKPAYTTNGVKALQSHLPDTAITYRGRIAIAP